MKNEITVLHAEQIAPTTGTVTKQTNTPNAIHDYMHHFMGCHCTCQLTGHTVEGILQQIGTDCFLLFNPKDNTTTLCTGAALQSITCRPPNFHP